MHTADMFSLTQLPKRSARLPPGSWDLPIMELLFGHQSFGLCTSTVTTVSEGGPRENTLESVSALCAQGRLKQALDILDRLEPPTDSATYVCLLRGCKALEDARRVHAHIIRSRLEHVMGNALVAMYSKCGSLVDARTLFDKMSRRDAVSWNAMIAVYAKQGRLEDARRMFDEMPSRNVVSWNAMIAACAKHGHGKEALELFGQMLQEKVKPTRVTFISILNACASPAALPEGKLIHNRIVDSGLDSDVVVGTALVNMYGKCGSLDDAISVFNKMPERNVISWNAMIAAYAQHGNGKEALELFQQMQQECVKPDKFTLSSILGACASLSALSEGKRIHACIVENGIESDVVLGTALVSMYGKCGSLDDARRVFDKMPLRNVVSWSAMIAAYAQHGNGRKAVQLFRQMQEEGVRPNNVTFVSVLSACSQAGLINEGHQFFDSMRQNYGITPTKEHYICMVDLLGRAGLLDEAEDIIYRMPFQPCAAVWMTLLGACRIHGNVERGKRAAECVLKLDPQKAAAYVVLSNIYASAGRLDDAAKVREVMADCGLK